ncbi:Six-hairpin glycosidase-like protein [Vararia minispora EC-137]|uniref:Six-hairpin glycosidase-like protein n=1 Tax=Vararia minispora EC-137 TaxID=1314806 RepID=A0ACB8QWI8_9AGAM|nr:Six-hairpin glycosidase-like protein [Vararia minispora EC-137]
MKAVALFLAATAVPHAHAAVTPSVASSATSVSVAIPSASIPSAPLPSQVQLPPKQAWCPSQIFCAGEVLQTVNLADVFIDPKSFVDKPTNSSPSTVFTAFTATGLNTTSATDGSVASFVSTYFRPEGLELEALDLGAEFNPNPAFLGNVSDPLVRAWAGIVHGYWTQLIRGTNASTLCDGVTCESTLIPLNHTFVVPGGRFREQYYWDSFWIVEGLLVSELYGIANSTLQNFMDEIERFGFIPNGGRIYYLNRSQPPLFIWMVYNYVAATNDTAILARALPLAERELAWWLTNRSVSVTSPYTNTTHTLYRYAVTNSAPRPESYLTDYLTANDPTLATPLNASERAALYAQLASGAESGWDYTTRFVARPLAGGVQDTAPALRSLNIVNHVPVDLNSILYKSHTLLAELYARNVSANATLASTHTSLASALASGILDLLWDPTRLAFYDFNLTSHTRNSLFSAASFYPLWVGLTPPSLHTNVTAAQGYFASLHMTMRRYNGTVPPTFVESGLQWDSPNAWPPHQYIALQALLSLPANISAGPLPEPPTGQSAFALLPAGQLGVEEAELPALVAGAQAPVGASADVNALTGGGVLGGGAVNASEGWRDALVRELANRYIASALCSWYSTGGEIDGLLPRLSDAALNLSGSIGNTGNMFEKFSIRNIDVGGSGGEYTVQAGFGWTNGVALWTAARFGDRLVAPACPNPLVEAAAASSTSSSATGTPVPTPTGPAGSVPSGTQRGGAPGGARSPVGVVVGALIALVVVL